MTKFFKKIDEFLAEGVLIDLSTIFVSAVFGKSLFEYRKINLSLCVKGIDSILEKAYKEFATKKTVNESFDTEISNFGEYVKLLEEFLNETKKGVFRKDLAKKLSSIVNSLNLEYFSPVIGNILKEHAKDFDKVRLIVGEFKVKKSDFDKKIKELAILKEELLELYEPEPVSGNSEETNNDEVEDEPSEIPDDNEDKKVVSIGKVPVTVEWPKSKKEAVTNFLINKYKVDVNNYLVDISKNKFNNPTAKARVEYNKTLDELWKKSKYDLYEKWKNIYLVEKLDNLFEVGIKMSSSTVYSNDIEKIEAPGAKRVLENLPLIDESSLEKGINLVEPDNFYMGSELDMHGNPTSSCIVFFIPKDHDQNENHAGYWALPIAKVRYRSLKYKIEDFFLTHDNKQDPTRSMYFVSNVRADMQSTANKLLLIKATPNAYNKNLLSGVYVREYTIAKREKLLTVVSPIFKVDELQMKEKFKIDKKVLKIDSYPKDKQEIEDTILKQKQIKK